MYKGTDVQETSVLLPQFYYDSKLFVEKVYFINILKSLAMKRLKSECQYGVIHWEIAERTEQCSVICPLHAKTYSSMHQH